MFLDVLVQPNPWLVHLTAVVNFYFADYSKLLLCRLLQELKLIVCSAGLLLKMPF